MRRSIEEAVVLTLVGPCCRSVLNLNRSLVRRRRSCNCDSVRLIAVVVVTASVVERR